MNTQGGPLEFEFDLDINQLQKKLAVVQTELSGVSGKLQKEGSMIDKAWAMGLSAIAGLAIGRFIGNTMRDIVTVRGEFQKLEAVLTNSFGDASRAKMALAMIQEFAAKTPFQVTDLTNSFVKLVNQGFTPSIEEMTKLGDLASSTGKGFDQLAEAIIDAQTFEFERLKEFGVRAAKEGDKITFTFKNQKTVVDASGEAIKKYILSLGNIEGVRGSMEAISKTTVGQISNMKDAWDQWLNTIGSKSEGGFSMALGWITSLISMVNEATLSLQQIQDKIAVKSANVNVQQSLDIIHNMENALVKSGMNVSEARKKAFDDYTKDLQKSLDETVYLQYQAGLKLDEVRSDNAKKGLIGQIFDGGALAAQQSAVDKFTVRIEELKNELTGLKEIQGKDNTDVPLNKEQISLANAQKKLDLLMKQTEEMSKQMFIQARSKEFEDTKQLGPKESKKFIEQYEKEYELEQKNLKAEKEKYKTILAEANAAAQFNTNIAKGVTISRIIADNFSGVGGKIEKITQDIAKEFERLGKMSEDFKTFSDPTATSTDKIYAAADAFSTVASQIAEVVASINSIKESKISSKLEASMLQVAYALDEINRAAAADKLQKFKDGLETIRKTGTEINSRYIGMSMADIQNSIVHYQSQIGTKFFDSQNAKIEKHLEDYQKLLKLKQDELDLQQQMNELLTGTTAEAITDSIVKGFEDGYDSVADFGKLFEDTMKQAVIKGLEMKLLSPFIAKWYAEFARSMDSGGGIDAKEEANLLLMWNGIMGKWTAATGEMNNMLDSWGFDTAAASQNTLSGGIKSITEDTADTLAGTMNSMRINGIQQLQVAQSGLVTLNKIEYNTGLTRFVIDVLKSIEGKMTSGNQFTSNRASGR